MTAAAVSPDRALPRSEAPLRTLYLAVFAALVLLRLPQVVLQGRFFSEEGQYFFAYAWHMPWTAALGHSFGGYGNLVANAGTLLAEILVRHGWVRLENAPYITEAVAFLFQLAPAVAILTARADWLAPPWARPVALLLIATVPAVEETWLHTLHSQFHLGLAAAILLVTEPATTPAARVFRLACLVLAPLAGPLALALLPAYALVTLAERTRGRALELAALSLGAALQFAFFWAPDPARRNAFDLVTFLNALVWRDGILPFLGPHVADRMAAHAMMALTSPGWTSGKAAALTVVAIGVAALATLSVLALRRWRAPASRLFLLAIGLSAISLYGSVNGGAWAVLSTNGQRYSLAPQVLLGLAALAACSGRFRLAPAFALLLMLSASAREYLQPSPDYAAGPSWREEVAKWRADPAYRPVVWMASFPPEFAMRVDLSDAPGGCDGPDATALYCNQDWSRLQAKLRAHAILRNFQF